MTSYVCQQLHVEKLIPEVLKGHTYQSSPPLRNFQNQVTILLGFIQNSPRPSLDTYHPTSLYTHCIKQSGNTGFGETELECWLCCVPESAVCLLISLNIYQRPVLGLCIQDTKTNKTCSSQLASC